MYLSSSADMDYCHKRSKRVFINRVNQYCEGCFTECEYLSDRDDGIEEYED